MDDAFEDVQPPPPRHDPLDALPSDVFELILLRVGAERCGGAAGVSRQWRTATLAPPLWLDALARAGCGVLAAHAPRAGPALRALFLDLLESGVITRIKSGVIAIACPRGRSRDSREVATGASDSLLLPLLDPDTARTRIAAASSVDEPSQNTDKLLDDDPSTFWSSVGSEDEDSEEWLTFELRQAVCLVKAVRLAAFRATFQQGLPTYAPKQLQIGLSYSAKALTAKGGFLPQDLGARDGSHHAEIVAVGDGEMVCGDDSHWQYVSPVFEVAHTFAEQTFELPELVPCRYVRLRMLGRRAVQPLLDERWYTCLRTVEMLGAPIGAVAQNTAECMLLHFNAHQEARKKRWAQAVTQAQSSGLPAVGRAPLDAYPLEEVGAFRQDEAVRALLAERQERLRASNELSSALALLLEQRASPVFTGLTQESKAQACRLLMAQPHERRIEQTFAKLKRAGIDEALYWRECLAPQSSFRLNAREAVAWLRHATGRRSAGAISEDVARLLAANRCEVSVELGDACLELELLQVAFRIYSRLHCQDRVLKCLVVLGHPQALMQYLMTQLQPEHDEYAELLAEFRRRHGLGRCLKLGLELLEHDQLTARELLRMLAGGEVGSEAEAVAALRDMRASADLLDVVDGAD